MFNGKIHYRWSCSIVILNYQRVFHAGGWSPCYFEIAFHLRTRTDINWPLFRTHSDIKGYYTAATKIYTGKLIISIHITILSPSHPHRYPCPTGWCHVIPPFWDVPLAHVGCWWRGANPKKDLACDPLSKSSITSSLKEDCPPEVPSGNQTWQWKIHYF